MIFNIYLITTVASIAADFTKMSIVRDNLLKKGYVISGKKKIDVFKTIYNLFMPGANVYQAYKLVKTDESKMEKEFLQDGIIHMPIESARTQYTEPITTEEKAEEVGTIEQACKGMTTEEQIEALKSQRRELLKGLSATEKQIESLGRQK